MSFAASSIFKTASSSRKGSSASRLVNRYARHRALASFWSTLALSPEEPPRPGLRRSGSL
eukprot:scaffold327_cov257-Pinguiococcus_pyrenoidosus.AAC.36